MIDEQNDTLPREGDRLKPSALDIHLRSDAPRRTLTKKVVERRLVGFKMPIANVI